MKFKIMGKKGDAVYDYDVATAEIKFNELFSAGMVPMIKESGKNQVAKVFKSDIEEITWIPQIAGG
ncbi:MAG: hypothetical protein ABIG69_06435 [Bacteroidota bacterium]